MKRREGFTLIELLMAIAILAVILLIAVTTIISSVNKGKEKAYNNQVSLFIDGARKYALEYNSEIEWQTDGDTVYTKVPLRLLMEYYYFDDLIMNSITGQPFNPDTAIVIIYKDGEQYEFVFEDETTKKLRLINNLKSQTISRSTKYTKQKIINDVIGLDKDKNDITNRVTYTCRYNNEEVNCNVLEATTKEIGTYYIEYKLSNVKEEKRDIRKIKVISTSKPIIEVRPDDDGKETKVDSVRVTIIYPEGAKSKTYSTKSSSNKTYTTSFDINENQTITADCIDKDGLKCETATREISHIKSKIEVR